MPFKKGNNLASEAGKTNKGSIKVNKDEWANFGEWVVKGGTERLNQELSTLKGKDFVNGFTSVLEYFKPKLARTELLGDASNPLTINITKYGDNPPVSVPSTSVPTSLPQSNGTEETGSMDRPS